MGDHSGKPAETVPLKPGELTPEQSDHSTKPGKHEKPKPAPKK
ncbi:hypothetical protein FHS44_005179 [Streptosporangium saharense]|uniref:Uncharacterized protein n=1 Tax=Streptosporangium saharense TaxID=1706840 RepID=A0A7W7VQ08_9ACTN|nr:hypothetical protein [Streptosporangium saharense]